MSTNTPTRFKLIPESKKVMLKVMANVLVSNEEELPNTINEVQYNRIRQRCTSSVRWYFRGGRARFPTLQDLTMRLNQREFRRDILTASRRARRRAAQRQQRLQEQQHVQQEQEQRQQVELQVENPRSEDGQQAEAGEDEDMMYLDTESSQKIASLLKENANLQVKLLNAEQLVARLSEQDREKSLLLAQLADEKAKFQVQVSYQFREMQTSWAEEKEKYQTQIGILELKNTNLASSFNKMLQQAQDEIKTLKAKAEEERLQSQAEILQVTEELRRVQNEANQARQEMQEALTIQEEQLRHAESRMDVMQSVIAHAPTFLDITYKTGFVAADPQSNRMVEVRRKIDRKRRLIGTQYEVVKACLNNGSLPEE